MRQIKPTNEKVIDSIRKSRNQVSCSVSCLVLQAREGEYSARLWSWRHSDSVFLRAGSLYTLRTRLSSCLFSAQCYSPYTRQCRNLIVLQETVDAALSSDLRSPGEIEKR